MVGVKGLEPSTSRSQTARASQLRHTPMVRLEKLYRKKVIFSSHLSVIDGYGIISIMLEAIALFAPSLIALRFYNHLHGNKLSARYLTMSYGLFVVFINLIMYLIVLYLFNQPSVQFDDKSFVNYVLFATILALIFPFVVNLVESSVSINVRRKFGKK